MQPTKSKRFNIVNKDGYSLDLEYNAEYVAVHLPYVKKFNKGTYLEIRESIDELLDFLEVVGYDFLVAGVEPSNKVTNRLVNKLGFEFLGLSHDKLYNIYKIEKEKD